MMQKYLTIFINFLSAVVIFLFNAALWLACWIAISIGSYYFLQRHEVNIDPKQFDVCVIDKNHNMPASGSFGEMTFTTLSDVTSQLPCDTPTPNTEIWYKADWVLKKINAEEWELHTYMGYWNDPHIFHYRVEEGKIIPMWEAQKFQLGQMFWAIFMGAIFTPFVMSKLYQIIQIKWLKKFFW